MEMLATVILCVVRSRFQRVLNSRFVSFVAAGACLVVAALYLIITEASREGKQLNELMHGLHMARYMILLMGLFAVYNGFVYNDALSLGLDMFGSRWEYACCCKSNLANATDLAQCTGHDEEIAVCPWNDVGASFSPNNGGVWYRSVECPDPVPVGMRAFPKGLEPSNNCVDDPTNALCPAGGSVYPFGIDPQWKHTANELLFVNSLKMKVSVILGVTQMTFGICLKGLNALFNKEYLEFFTDFVPQLLFTSCLFIYMVIMILIKWTINWDLRMGHGTNSTTGMPMPCDLGFGGDGQGCQPPSLISTLIDIALKPGTVADPMFASQASLQVVLVLGAFLSVPIMLFAKPCLLSRAHKRQQERQTDPGYVEVAADDGHGHGHGGEFNFGEIMIHQGIETIEFVLGMISNTASYLRLWALSLAHTELAGVFWEKVMIMGINNGPVAAFIAFAVFAGITTAVLLLMDVLECFLHALRLHWVEFQNKFYKADGYSFVPLNFKDLLKNAD
jgi:V-type H+-transporting ATPase subunit a